MSILTEGGNIWPDTHGFDQAHAKSLKATIDKYLEGTGLEAYPIGSAATPTPGKISGDFDVLVDMGQAMKTFGTQDPKEARIALEKFLQQKGLDTRRIAVTVHTKVPFNNHYHQVDIKVVNNAQQVAKYHTHDLPKGSPYKGVHKQLVMNALATSQGLLWSPDEGLYKRDAAGKKAELLSTDFDEIAKALLGPKANAASLGSVESILAAIPDEARRNEIFNIAKNSKSWPAEPTPVGTNEWFRRLIDKMII